MAGPIGCGVDGAARVTRGMGLVCAAAVVRPGAEERSGPDHELSHDALLRWEWEGGAAAAAGEGRHGDDVELASGASDV